MKKFKTIRNNVTSEIEEKRSKFIANLFYVESVEEAENIIKQIKKKYYDAKHNCYAYIVNQTQMIKKSGDDGEPSGTAGSPILNVIEKNNLCNVLVVVTRYFGGVLLGVGGLVRAYTESTAKAIEIADIIEQEEGYEVELTIRYQELQKFKYYCGKNNINILNIKYQENINCLIEVTNAEKEKLLRNYENNDKMVEILKINIIRQKYIKYK